MSSHQDVIDIARTVRDAIDKGLNIVDFFSDLFGFGRPADLSKFSRTVYPWMAAQAELTNFEVCSAWFGELICVRPNRSFYKRLILPARTAAGVEGWEVVIPQLRAAGEVFWFVRMKDPKDVGNLEDFNKVARNIFFEPVNIPGVENPTDPGGLPPVVDPGLFGGFSTQDLVLIGGGLLILFLLVRRGS